MQGWQPCSLKNLLLLNPKKWKPHGLNLRNGQTWHNLLRTATAQKGFFRQWWWWLWWRQRLHIDIWNQYEIFHSSDPTIICCSQKRSQYHISIYLWARSCKDGSGFCGSLTLCKCEQFKEVIRLEKTPLTWVSQHFVAEKLFENLTMVYLKQWRSTLQKCDWCKFNHWVAARIM